MRGYLKKLMKKCCIRVYYFKILEYGEYREDFKRKVDYIERIRFEIVFLIVIVGVVE